MSTKSIQNTILIKATSSIVWDTLTSPKETKKYMFGCETDSDWKEGSSLLWKMEIDGKEMVAVKGKIIDLEPGVYLAYTVFDPNSIIPDIPENYLTVTYHLLYQEGHTVLTVTQGDFSKVAEGQRRYQEASNNGEGWNPILVQIKAIAEAHVSSHP